MKNNFLSFILKKGTLTTQITLVTFSVLLVWLFNQFDFLKLLSSDDSELQVRVSRFEIFLVLTLLFLNISVTYSLLRQFKGNNRVMKVSTSVIILTLLVICVWIARVFNLESFIVQAQASVQGGTNRIELILLFILILISIMATLTLFRKYNNIDSIVVMSAYSKKVQYKGEWVSVEKFIQDELGVQISHGITPEEKEQAIKDFEATMQKRKKVEN